MDAKMPVNQSGGKQIVAGVQEKEWFKKLAAASGKPLELKSPQKGRIVFVVVDCSPSMAEGDKMSQARKGSIGFSEQALGRGYAVGVIAFSDMSEYVLEPKTELPAIKREVGKMRADREGSTNMAVAIKQAADSFGDIIGERVMCIVTDGMPDNQKAALDVAEKAKQAGIDIMTIGTDDADEEFLARLATRKELSRKVQRDQLQSGIVSMAGLLPYKPAS